MVHMVWFERYYNVITTLYAGDRILLLLAYVCVGNKYNGVLFDILSRKEMCGLVFMSRKSISSVRGLVLDPGNKPPFSFILRTESDQGPNDRAEAVLSGASYLEDTGLLGN